MLSIWILLGTIQFLLKQPYLTMQHWGLSLAHIGVGISLIGIACVSNFSVEHEILMRENETVSIKDYTVLFQAVQLVEGDNYLSHQGIFKIFHKNNLVAQLKPERRLFLIQELTLSETAISPGFFKDIYIALGEKMKDDNAYAVRIYYKPFVRWIWAGGLLMALGALLASISRKKKLQNPTIVAHL